MLGHYRLQRPHCWTGTGLKTCAAGTRYAAETGAWAAIATSNFCGPQFVGMWRDIDWHRELTDLIKSSPLPHGQQADPGRQGRATGLSQGRCY